MAVRIGELLLKEKRITPAQLQEALNYQKQNGGKLGFNLVKLGYVKERRSPRSSRSSTAFPPSI
jgi:type IV pilus assembly protein PilB